MTVPGWDEQLGTELLKGTTKLDLFLPLQQVSTCTVGLQAAALSTVLVDSGVGPVPDLVAWTLVTHGVSSQGEAQPSLRSEL